MSEYLKTGRQFEKATMDSYYTFPFITNLFRQEKTENGEMVIVTCVATVVRIRSKTDGNWYKSLIRRTKITPLQYIGNGVVLEMVDDVTKQAYLHSQTVDPFYYVKQAPEFCELDKDQTSEEDRLIGLNKRCIL